MDNTTLTVIKLLFIPGFTLQNLEEALWLPKWSQLAKKFHNPVTTNEFIFAVLIITTIGYLLTAIDLFFGQTANLANLIFLGFVGMMGINSFFLHLIATIVTKKYSPGLITGLLLNLTFSIIIFNEYIRREINPVYLVLSVILVSAVILLSLKPLFRIGSQIINYSQNI